MKKKILSLTLIIAMLGGILILLTGCEENSNKIYSKMINVVRNAATSVGPTFGETLDYGLENSNWTEKTMSVYTTEVKVTGKDRETGDSIEIGWEVTSPGGDDHNYKLKTFTRNGEDKGAFSASSYIREYALKVKEQN